MLGMIRIHQSLQEARIPRYPAGNPLAEPNGRQRGSGRGGRRTGKDFIDDERMLQEIAHVVPEVEGIALGAEEFAEGAPAPSLTRPGTPLMKTSVRCDSVTQFVRLRPYMQHHLPGNRREPSSHTTFRD